MRGLAMLVLAWTGLTLGAPIGSAVAAEPTVTVQLLPESVALPLDGSGAVAVRVVNSGDSGVLATPSIGTGGLVEPVAGLVTREVAAGGSALWELELTSAENAVLPGTLVVAVEYGPSAAAGAASSVTAAALAITAAPLLPVADVAAVSMDAGASRVDDIHATTVALVVRNTSGRPITLRDVVPHAPVYVDVTATPREPHDLQIAPMTDVVLDYALQGTGALEHGDAVVEFTARISYGPGRQDGELSVSHPIQVGAYGESDLGMLLSIPTLLVLPGLFALVTVSLAWRFPRLRPAGAPESFYLAARDAEFWTVAILVSLAAVFAYWVGSDGHQSLLRGYGSKDVLWLSASTILVTLIAYTVVTLVSRRRAAAATKHAEDLAEAAAAEARAAAEATAARVGMTPLEVLDLLVARRSGTWAPWAVEEADGERRVVLVLGESGSSRLICSPISLSLRPPSNRQSALLPQPVQQLERDLCTALSRDGRAERVKDLIDGGAARDWVQLSWRSIRGVEGVQRGANDLAPLPGSSPLIRLS